MLLNHEQITGLGARIATKNVPEFVSILQLIRLFINLPLDDSSPCLSPRYQIAISKRLLQDGDDLWERAEAAHYPVVLGELLRDVENEFQRLTGATERSFSERVSRSLFLFLASGLSFSKWTCSLESLDTARPQSCLYLSTKWVTAAEGGQNRFCSNRVSGVGSL